MLNLFVPRDDNKLEPPPASRVVESPCLVGDARKKLRCLINTPPENYAVAMDITPSMAGIMMERNVDDDWRNRPASGRGLRRYVDSMKRGWRFTGEPIIFSKSGRLLNGQHRLMAAIEAGATFRSLVVFGIEDDAFKWMDIGITRTAGHIFGIEGIPNYNLAAAISRILYSYYSSTTWMGSVVDIENDDLLDFYRTHQGVQGSLHYASLMNKEGLLSPRWAGALHYLCSTKSRAAADAFFEKLATGIGLNSKTDPIYMLRARILKNTRVTSPADREAELYLAAYVVLTWNDVRSSSRRGVIKWRTQQAPNQPFPRVQ